MFAMRVALYAGSFDPITLGHLDIVRQSARLFDRLIIAVGVHPGKRPLFNFEEREALIGRTVAEIGEAAECQFCVAAFGGLAIEAAREHGASVLVRGIRDGTDLDYEMQMAGMNGRMAPEITTIFLPASLETRPITATLVRQIAAMGGDVAAFVPAAVASALRAKAGPLSPAGSPPQQQDLS